MEDKVHIHENTLQTMWENAASLTNDPAMISKAPGCTSEYARMVASTIMEVPHFVTTPKQYTIAGV